MNKHLVSIVPYEKPLESVRKAVELSRGLAQLPPNARVFIKPNIVFWTKAVAFPKWGVITTSRVVEDMIILLKERGIDDITMQPTPGKKKTILMGKCIYQAHKNNPVINEAIPIKGCPPKPEEMLKALHKAGIKADPGLFEKIEQLPGFYMGRYQDKPEFDEGFFRVE